MLSLMLYKMWQFHYRQSIAVLIINDEFYDNKRKFF